MIERHVSCEVVSGKKQQFENFYREHYRPAMMKSAGFVSLDLIVEVENLDRYQMVIRFTAAEKSETWRASEAHKALSPILKSLVSAITVVVYEVVA